MNQLTNYIVNQPDHLQSQAAEKIPDEMVRDSISLASGNLTMRIGKRIKEVIEQPEKLTPYARGKYYQAINNPEMAKESYEEAIKHNENPAEAYNNLGSIALQKQDLAGAIYNLKRSLALGLTDAHNNLAMCYLKMKKSELAERHYKLADTPMANYNLGLNYINTGRYDQAVKHLRMALNEKLDKGHYLLACAYLHLGRNADGNEMMATAAAKKDGRAHVYFAQKYSNEGNHKKAEEHMQAAQKCGMLRIIHEIDTTDKFTSKYGPN